MNEWLTDIAMYDKYKNILQSKLKLKRDFTLYHSHNNATMLKKNPISSIFNSEFRHYSTYFIIQSSFFVLFYFVPHMNLQHICMSWSLLWFRRLSTIYDIINCHTGLWTFIFNIWAVQDLITNGMLLICRITSLLY